MHNARCCTAAGFISKLVINLLKLFSYQFLTFSMTYFCHQVRHHNPLQLPLTSDLFMNWVKTWAYFASEDQWSITLLYYVTLDERVSHIAQWCFAGTKHYRLANVTKQSRIASSVINVLMLYVHALTWLPFLFPRGSRPVLWTNVGCSCLTISRWRGRETGDDQRLSDDTPIVQYIPLCVCVYMQSLVLVWSTLAERALGYHDKGQQTKAAYYTWGTNM